MKKNGRKVETMSTDDFVLHYGIFVESDGIRHSQELSKEFINQVTPAEAIRYAIKKYDGLDGEIIVSGKKLEKYVKKQKNEFSGQIF